MVCLRVLQLEKDGLQRVLSVHLSSRFQRTQDTPQDSTFLRFIYANFYLLLELYIGFKNKKPIFLAPRTYIYRIYIGYIILFKNVTVRVRLVCHLRNWIGRTFALRKKRKTVIRRYRLGGSLLIGKNNVAMSPLTFVATAAVL